MRFTKKNNIYRIVRITGPEANILDGVYGEDDRMEIVEWSIREGEEIQTIT